MDMDWECSTAAQVIALSHEPDLVMLLKRPNHNFHNPGEIKVAVRVSSAALKLSCHHWKVILSGRFAENNITKTITLEGDDFVAILTLLRISHHCNDEIPTNIAFGELVEMAFVVDKYQAHRLVIPWLPLWIKPHIAMVGHTHYAARIWIAWVFGLPRAFTMAANQLLRSADDDGNYNVGECFGRAIEDLMPPGMEVQIKARRHFYLDNLCSNFKGTVRQYRTALSPSSVPICKMAGDTVAGRAAFDDGDVSCSDVAFYEALTYYMVTNDLGPEGEKIRTKTFQELLVILSGMEQHLARLGGWHSDPPCPEGEDYYYCHRKCIFHLLRNVEEFLKWVKWTSPVTRSNMSVM